MINERSQQLLRLLIERHIHEGIPVGSKVLAEHFSLSLSPATIRHVLADLEAMGYLHSPHISAGRIPTHKAYRFFVDQLLSTQIKPLQDPLLAKKITANQDTKSVVAAASNLLSGLTELAGIVTTPTRAGLTIEHIEFLPLSENRILVILVYNDRDIENRVIYTQRNYSRQELEQAANYLTSLCKGNDLQQMKQRIAEEINSEQTRADKMIETALQLMQQTFSQQSNENDFVISGETNLFDLIDQDHLPDLKPLLEAIHQKQEILHLLDNCLNAEGVQIYIGGESGYEVLGNYSVVSAPYAVEGKVMGVLGVIGPVRMRYDKVISIVDMTAKLLGRALNNSK